MYKHLTSEQRYYIYKEYTKGSTQKSIAKTIGVSESTVSRELKRNRGKAGGYNFLDAQRRAEEKAIERLEIALPHHIYYGRLRNLL